MSKMAFGLVNVTFDVRLNPSLSTSSWYADTEQLLKEQNKYDNMVSALAAGIGRILPFAEHMLDDALCNEAELLKPLIKKLFDLMVEAATFICEYAKRSPSSMPVSSGNLLELTSK